MGLQLWICNNINKDNSKWKDNPNDKLSPQETCTREPRHKSATTKKRKTVATTRSKRTPYGNKFRTSRDLSHDNIGQIIKNINGDSNYNKNRNKNKGRQTGTKRMKVIVKKNKCMDESLTGTANELTQKNGKKKEREINVSNANDTESETYYDCVDEWLPPMSRRIDIKNNIKNKTKTNSDNKDENKRKRKESTGL